MKTLRYLKNPRRIILSLNRRLFWTFLPDKLFIQLMYYANMGKKLDLKNPKTYNEKLQWLKLYDRRPEYTIMVDKYRVRDYVEKTIGKEYLIPLLGKWDDPDEIDIDALPDQFVLKCNHDSGSIVICKDKADFDFDKAKKMLKRHLRCGTYIRGREWPYKNVKACVIAEEYMQDDATGELRDYKFFTFNGEVKALFIATDRQNEYKATAFDFFDREFHHLDIRHGHPNAGSMPEKPYNFEKMIELAERLSKGIPEVRVDFYEVNQKIYFGEMTFFHRSGWIPFDPEEWDLRFGEWIHLPKKNAEAR